MTNALPVGKHVALVNGRMFIVVVRANGAPTFTPATPAQSRVLVPTVICEGQ